MSYRILTKNSVDNTNIDGARQNHFNAGMRSGVVKGALNECNVTSPASNQIVINTGELRISGHQVVITESEQIELTNTPQTATDYSIIAEISVDALSTPIFRMFIQPKSSGLIQDNLFTTLNGVGTYQIKLANFTQNSDGSISNLQRVADLIIGITKEEIENATINKADNDAGNLSDANVYSWASKCKFERVETVYDKDSSNSSINWGYTSGITTSSNNIVITGKNFTKYKKLLISVGYKTESPNNPAQIGILDLSTLPESATEYLLSMFMANAWSIINNSGIQIYACVVQVNSAKTSLAFYPRAGNAAAGQGYQNDGNLCIMKIEGVY